MSLVSDKLTAIFKYFSHKISLKEMASTIYGIISDVHEHPEHVATAVDALIANGAQKLIFNGDAVDETKSIRQSQNNLRTTIQTLAKTGIDFYFQPGSHERMATILPVIRELQKQYGNLHFTIDQPFLQGDNHDLLFIPGSDSLNTGEFQITTELPSGPYFLVPDPIQKQTRPIGIGLDDLTDELLNLMHPGQSQQRYIINPNDLAKYIRDGAKTIAICHVPSKSNNKQYGVDVAYFGRQQNGAIIPGIVLERQIIDHVRKQANRDPTREEIYQIALQNGIQLQIDNVGNEDLRDFYQKHGITRAINGHIHEAGHRSHTTDDQPLKQNEWTNNLLWNSGCLDMNQCGLMEVDGPNVRYRNIQINQSSNYGLNLPPIQQTGAPSSKIILPGQEPRPPQPNQQQPAPRPTGIITPGQISTNDLKRYQRQ